MYFENRSIYHIVHLNRKHMRYHATLPCLRPTIYQVAQLDVVNLITLV